MTSERLFMALGILSIVLNHCSSVGVYCCLEFQGRMGRMGGWQEGCMDSVWCRVGNEIWELLRLGLGIL